MLIEPGGVAAHAAAEIDRWSIWDEEAFGKSVEVGGRDVRVALCHGGGFFVVEGFGLWVHGDSIITGECVWGKLAFAKDKTTLVFQRGPKRLEAYAARGWCRACLTSEELSISYVICGRKLRPQVG